MRRYAAILTLASIALASNPSTATATVQPTKVIFGYSVERRPLVAYVLGNGPNVTAVFGAFHGDERESPTAVRALLRQLEAHPNELVGRTVVLVPIANPDGWARSTRTNAHGVDLNRNFPIDWKPLGGSRYRSGRRRESEPETRAIIGLLETYHPQKIVSIHQPLHCMIYTGTQGYRLARTMHAYLDYRVTDHSVRPTPGSFGLYCGVGQGEAIVTMELGRSPSRRTFADADRALIAAVKSDVIWAHRRP